MNTHPRNKKAGPLTIRVAGEQELKRFNQLLDERHPQQTPPHVGRELRVVIEQDGDWIAVMLWTSACQRLQDRDEWIGWTNAQRAQRLNLLVQLRRYLLLHEAGTRPNLASEALAAATRALPGLWQASFRCEPLLVESFSDIAQIQRFSWRLLGPQRAALGFRRKPGKATFRMPGYSVYRDVLIALDLDAFAQILSAWLTAHHGSLPAALALDGKMIRDTIGVLSVVDVETRVPVSMRILTQKEGDGERCEKIAARHTVEQMSDGQGSLLSGDALHTDKTMAGLTVEHGWDYLLQVKGNQPTIQAHLARKTAPTPFLT